jgi:hypothetical protein
MQVSDTLGKWVAKCPQCKESVDCHQVDSCHPREVANGTDEPPKPHWPRNRKPVKCPNPQCLHDFYARREDLKYVSLLKST